MNVKHKELDSKGKFYIDDNGEEIAEMTYVFIEDDKIDINHTFIKESYRGADLGTQLIEASVNFMRKHDLTAVPTCPYVKKVFGDTSDYDDVRA